LVKNPLECAEGEITQKFMSRLERKLIEAPNDWLWTHNRWKHKKEQSSVIV
jgi:Kdo2-lipid IVA lauroyltransferase/acyltransferase